jgi:hypothetical protein
MISAIRPSTASAPEILAASETRRCHFGGSERIKGKEDVENLAIGLSLPNTA